MKNPEILITKEDEVLCQNLKGILTDHGFEVIKAPDKTGIFRFFLSSNPDLIILGSCSRNPKDGLRLAAQLRKRDTKTPIILITKYTSEARAIAALRAGVTDYFKVPFSYDELLINIKQHIQERETNFPEIDGDNEIIGNSKPMQEIKSYLSKVAATDSTVLITGETGTGKELAAEFIHQKSPRHKKPFVCVNCAALPETLIESEMFGYERGAFTGAVALSRGKFEQAEGGTVFLDEIGDMSPYAQSKILRTIERKEVHRLGGKKVIPIDVRVTAATNQNPEQLVEKRKFREDLYYRLNVARVHMPPLRDRKEDIPRLVVHTIRKLNNRFGREVEGLTGEAMDCLIKYDWPGNVRELINLIEAAFINLPSRKITFVDLPKTFRKRLKETKDLPEKERDQVLSALFTNNWNKSKAAQKLHWSRMTLYRKIAKYNITASPKPKMAE